MREELVEFSKRIRLFVHSAGVEKKDVAAAGEVNPATMSGYLKGNSQPTMRTLALWQRKFGVNLNWLCTGEGEMFLQADNAGKGAPLGSASCTQTVYPEASGAGATSFTQLAGRVNRLDPIAERIEVVSRELRASGAEPEEVRQAIMLVLESSRANQRHTYGSLEEPQRAKEAAQPQDQTRQTGKTPIKSDA